MAAEETAFSFIHFDTIFRLIGTDHLDYHHYGRVFVLNNRAERKSQFLRQPDSITEVEEATSAAHPVLREFQRFPERARKLIELLPHQEVFSFGLYPFDVFCGFYFRFGPFPGTYYPI